MGNTINVIGPCKDRANITTEVNMRLNANSLLFYVSWYLVNNPEDEKEHCDATLHYQDDGHD